ncbi:MAG: hypothetical protein NTW19_18570 [Planctomycetota bacterium]|nr:hypothetical protein [Planctomycetota bacterium]
MDNRHRHELDQNDLQHFLTHMGPFWDKWGMPILLGILVAVGGYTGKVYYDRHVDDQHQSAVRDLELATSPESLRGVAQQASEPGIAAVALLRGADLALASAVMPEPPVPPSTQPSEARAKGPLSAEDRKAALKDAEQMYKAVIDQPAAAPVVKLNARMGLAAAAESRSDWEAASKLYQETADQAGLYEVIKSRAQKRQALIAELKSPVAFAPEPATQSASMLPPGMGGSMVPLRSAANPMPPATTRPADASDETPAAVEQPAAPEKTVAPEKPAAPAKPAAEKPAAKPAPAKKPAKPAADR